MLHSKQGAREIIILIILIEAFIQDTVNECSVNSLKVCTVLKVIGLRTHKKPSSFIILSALCFGCGSTDFSSTCFYFLLEHILSYESSRSQGVCFFSFPVMQRKIWHTEQEYRWMEITLFLFSRFCPKNAYCVLTDYSLFSPCPPLLSLPPPPHLYNATDSVSTHACYYKNKMS